METQMNCMSKKVLRRKEQIAEERRKVEEEKYLNSLSDEERIAFLKAKEERGRQAMRFVTTAMAVSASVFGMNRRGGEDNG